MEPELEKLRYSTIKAFKFLQNKPEKMSTLRLQLEYAVKKIIMKILLSR